MSGSARFWTPAGLEVLTEPLERAEGDPGDLPRVLARVEATPGRWAGWVAADGRSRFTRYGAARRQASWPAATPEPPKAGPVTVSLDRAGYEAAVASVLEAIGRGDCYQVNLCIRFEVEEVGVRAAELWHGLVARLRPPFAGLLDDPDHQVASVSPERFLEVDGRRVLTSPIKGTRPRGSDQAADERLAAELAADPKELAENVMIVDLLRNDLGRVARLGSVRADPAGLFQVETFPHLHHLVSDVEAELAPGNGLAELFAATFPPGSVTGAPKLAALEQIAALEPVPRGVSMGAVGWVAATGDPGTLRARFAVAIRTVELAGSRAWFCAGAGIVADSRPAAEHAEVELKAASLLEALGA